MFPFVFIVILIVAGGFRRSLARLEVFGANQWESAKDLNVSRLSNQSHGDQSRREEEWD